MPLPEFAVLTLLAAVFLWLATSWLCRNHQMPRGTIMFATLSLLAKAILIAIVHRHPEFEQKQAADIPVLMRENWKDSGVESLLDDPTFALTTLAASPGYMMSEPNYQAAPLVHSMAIGLGAVVVAAAMGSATLGPASWRALVLLTWWPSSIYWGLHGLRDPMIYLATSTAVAGTIRIADGQRHGWGGIPWMLAAVSMLLVARPEISPLPVVAASAAVFLSPKTRGLRPILLAFLLLAILATPVILRDQLSLDETSMDAIEEAVKDRENRALDRGNESSLFGADSLLSEAPPWLPLRILLQFGGLVACPFPRVPRGVMDIAVGVESAAWIVALAAPWFPCVRTDPRSRRTSRVCGLVAIVGLLAYAPLTVNAGNAFRLRFSVLPFAIAAATAAIPPRIRVARQAEGGLHAKHA